MWGEGSAEQPLRGSLDRKRGQMGAGSPVRRRLALSRVSLGRGGLNPTSGNGGEEGTSSGDLH